MITNSDISKLKYITRLILSYPNIKGKRQNVYVPIKISGGTLQLAYSCINEIPFSLIPLFKTQEETLNFINCIGWKNISFYLKKSKYVFYKSQFHKLDKELSTIFINYIPFYR